ncbi:MAG TPA: B12-binding domain-containing radical SAM protein [bacterium]|nr:B12-binding domain-containing radical SAM protein [bacterium]
MAKVMFLIQREDLDPSRAVMRKVLFPIETAFAAALLKSKGHEVGAFDLNLMEEGDSWLRRFRGALEGFSPDIVVSAPQTLTFLIRENIGETAAAFSVAKSVDASIKTVYCGQAATSYPGKAFSEARPDYLIRGEYEEPLAAFAERADVSGSFENIPGLASGIVEAEAIPPRPSVFFGSLPFPAYEEFEYEKYFDFRGKGNIRHAEHSRRHTHYLTSRGCSARCCFCNVSYLRGSRVHQVRPVVSVLDDLERITLELGVQEIHFLDENMTLSRKRTLEICRGIAERRLDFKWIPSGGLSVYSLNRQILENLKASGCYRLNLAIESGSQDALKNIIRKPVNLKKAAEVVRIARELDFEIICFFVIGFPGETRAQIEETLSLAANPDFDYVTISIATPQAGTELEKICEKDGLIEKGRMLADISKRSTGVFSTDQFSLYELEEIRWKKWDEINFSTEKRILKIQKMMGVSLEELNEIRERTRTNFLSRWRDRDSI